MLPEKEAIVEVLEEVWPFLEGSIAKVAQVRIQQGHLGVP